MEAKQIIVQLIKGIIRIRTCFETKVPFFSGHARPPPIVILTLIHQEILTKNLKEYLISSLDAPSVK